MKSMKKIGLLTAAAFALTATASFVSAQYISTIPGSAGNTFGGNNCGCVGGATSKSGCFACCNTNDVHGAWFEIDPGNIRACFSYCGLQRRNSPCRGVYGGSSQLPG